jgi:hypothetical protein
MITQFSNSSTLIFDTFSSADCFSGILYHYLHFYVASLWIYTFACLVCLRTANISQSLKEGYIVYGLMDADGDSTPDAHNMAFIQITGQ